MNTTPNITVPSEVLHAVCAGNKMVIITGAGCSVERPTNLPAGSKLARDAHEQLVADNVLRDGECPDKENLSVLADTVFAAKGSQAALVERMHVDEMRAATPNHGHLVAAALLREGAIACVVTLNFDNALSGAVAQLGVGKEVSIVTGPRDHGRLSDPSIVYLHGTAYDDPEDWILRTADLLKWTPTQWRAVIAARVLCAPVVVFAGLGSRADVLTETLTRIRTEIPDGVHVVQVDPAPRDRSAFSEALQVEDGNYVQMGWCHFMNDLSSRVVLEHVGEIVREAERLIVQESWHTEDTGAFNLQLRTLPLVELGGLRSSWLLESRPYLPRNEAQVGHIADLALALMLVARATNTIWEIRDSGLVEFRDETDRVLGSIAFVSGCHTRRWLSLQTVVTQTLHESRSAKPTAVIASGYVGDVKISANPPSILSSEDEESIVAGPAPPRLVPADVLRSNPSGIREAVFS